MNTTLCYLRRGERYLMLHRIKKKNDLNQDKWIGVGGKFEDKESPEDCVRRELEEETGLVPENLRFRGSITFISDRWPTENRRLFTAESAQGEPRECAEGVLEWLPREELLKIPHWEGDAIFLDLIQRDVPFFSLQLCYEGDKLVYAALNGETIKGE